MSLDAYDHYWSSARGLGEEQRRRRMAQIRERAGVRSGFGSGDDPIGAQSPMVQDRMLQQLARRAAGRIDDWESLIDPTLSYGENLRKIQQKGGKKLDSTEERERKRAIANNETRQQRRAKRAIRDNLDSIENGESKRLLGDIRQEFGEAFVESAIVEARALETPTPEAPVPGSGRDEPETPASPASPAAADPADATPEPAVSPKYQGFLGLVRLFLAYTLLSTVEAARSAGATARTAALIVELEIRQEIRPQITEARRTLAIYSKWYRLRLTNERPRTNQQ